MSALPASVDVGTAAAAAPAEGDEQKGELSKKSQTLPLLSATSHSPTPTLTSPLPCSPRVCLFSAAKRLAKAQAKEAEKAAKASSKPSTTLAGVESRKKKSKTATGEDGDEEDVDPTAYFDQRVRELTEMRAAGQHRHLYPHKFHASMSVPQFQFEFTQQDIANGVRLEREVSVAGRVYTKRSSGASLFFYDLQAQGGRVQVVADRKSDKDDWSIHEHIRRGHHHTQHTHDTQQPTTSTRTHGTACTRPSVMTR